MRKKNLTPVLLFSFQPDAVLQSFIPTAFVINSQGYIQKNATPSILQSYHISISDTESQLLEIGYSLSHEKLLDKYNAKQKVKKSLSTLLSDKATEKIIKQFIAFKVTAFLKLWAKHPVPLSVNASKEKPVELINPEVGQLHPILKFVKNTEGIAYTLSLSNDLLNIYPSQQQTILLVNEPAWIIINRNMYQVLEVNAHKIKPFLDKPTLNIPQKNVAQYFQVFIKDIVKKATVEAEGFTIHTQNTLSSWSLLPVYHLSSGTYKLAVSFTYNDVEFLSSKIQNTHSNLLVEQDDFVIIKTQRNALEEAKVYQQLEGVGIKFSESGIGDFDHTHSTLWTCIESCLQHYPVLEQLGISLQSFNHLGKQVYIQSCTVTGQLTETPQGYQVQIMVSYGTFTFPLTQLAGHIQGSDPLYPLSDGYYMFIPQYFFKQYKPLFTFGTILQNTILVQKNQFSLLEDLSLENIASNESVVEFSPTTTLQATLRPYQTEGVQWLLKHNYKQLGACLADDMGLGKTLQILALLDYNKQDQNQPFTVESDLFSETEPITQAPLKALVVCPSSLVYNWLREVRKFTPHFSAVNYSGPDRILKTILFSKADIVCTSYPILLKDIAIFKKYTWNYLIIDESQQIKNRNSKIFEAINQVPTTHKIALSGTPIENSLADLWSQMQFINPNLLGSYTFFNDYFKNPIEKNNDVDKTNELKQLVNPYILRRSKKQVAQDLPPLVEQVFYCEMTPEQENLYNIEKAEAQINFFSEPSAQPTNKLSILNVLLRLRQLANHPVLLNEQAHSGKFNDVTEYLTTLVKSNQKVLIFSTFVAHLELYTQWCQKQKIKYVSLTGKTATEDRQTVIKRFQTTDTPLFFISLKAGGVGLNLTEASYVLLLDPWWNPFAEQQAIGRAHRIGQQNQVNVIRFITQNTIEEKILQLQQQKITLSENIIDDQAIPENIWENLPFLFS